MKLKRLARGLIFAPAAALLLGAMPEAAMADPPHVPPGHAKKFGGGRGCPPGLAKKNPLCMPPGQYKKLHRGDRIPDWRSYDRLHWREYGLRRPGPNEHYIRIGRDAYLIAEGTQRVIEIINLLDGRR